MTDSDEWPDEVKIDEQAFETVGGGPVKLGCRLGWHAWGTYTVVGKKNLYDYGDEMPYGTVYIYEARCQNCTRPKIIRKVLE